MNKTAKTTAINEKINAFFNFFILAIKNYESPSSKNMINIILEGPKFVIRGMIAIPPKAAPKRSIK